MAVIKPLVNYVGTIKEQQAGDTISGLVIGTNVQAYDANTAKLNAAQAWTAKQTFGEIAETVYALSGTTPALNPANGTVQTWTLSGNSSPTDSLAAGESITLMIDDGTAYAITWPTLSWLGGAPPGLATTGYTVIAVWKVGSILYGSVGTAGASGPTGATGATGATGSIGPKGVSIANPGAAEKCGLFFTTIGGTVSKVAAVLPGGTSTPSVTYTLRYGTDISGAGTQILSATVTSVTTATAVTSFDNAVIPANNLVWLTTTAKSGTVPMLSVSAEF